MIFKKKTPPPVPRTVIRCNGCGADTKRPHAGGDYVCMGVQCPRCDHAAYVRGIYGEEPEQ